MHSSDSSSRLALWLSWIVAGVLVLLPFHAPLSIWLGSNLGHLDLIRIWKEITLVAILPLVGWLAFSKTELRRWLLTSWIVRLFSLYILLHFLLGIWALHHHQVNASAFIYALIINLRFVGFFLICAILASSSRFLRKHWQSIVLWPALIVIVFGILQIVALPRDFLRHFGYGPSTIPAYQTVDSNLDYRRIQSSLRGANPLGAYLVLLLPAIFLIARENRWLRYGSLAGCLLVLLYTYSRSAWLGLIITVLVLVGLSRKIKVKRTWVAVGIPALLILLATGLLLVRSDQSLQDTLFHTSSASTNTSSNAVRLSAIKSGLADIYHQPLGRGPGTAGPASFRNSSGHGARIAEDYFVQIGQEVGLIGAALMIAIMALVGRELYLRRDDQLALLLLASLIGLTFVNLISHAWTDDTLAYIWWGLAGIACAPAILKSQPKQNENKPKPKTLNPAG